MKHLVAACLVYLCSATAAAQSTGDDLAEHARSASLPYQDLQAAIAAGYRKLGPDLPNMGEHWVQPRYAVRPAFDPGRPSMLTYVRVKGEPVLTGVAYTIGIADGEPAPPSPVPGVDWHFHSGAIEEEIFGGMHHAHDGFRVGMIHAWVWTTNPDGIFEADNWGLSFVRLGLPVPEHVPPAAAKALFLLEGGIDHYMRLIDSATALPPSVKDRVLEHFESKAALAGELVSDAAPESPPLASLSTLWRELWLDVKKTIAPAEWTKIEVLSK